MAQISKNVQLSNSKKVEISLKSLQGAIQWVKHGYRVFPCYINKSPAVPKGTNWQDYPLMSPEGLKKHHAKHPYILWGLILEGIYVIDVDSYNKNFNGKSKDIANSLEILHQVKQTTLRGGRHYFAKGRCKNTTSKLAPGIDSKSDGGYVVIYEPPEGNIREMKAFAPPLILQIKQQIDEEGTRNTLLYQRLKDATLAGDRPAYDKAIAIAKKSGLSDAEIQKTIESVKKEVGPPPKPNTTPDTPPSNVVSITKDNPLFHPTAKKPYIEMAEPCKIDTTGFAYPGFFPFGGISFVYGDGDVGKSTLMAIIAHRNFHKLPLWDGSNYLGDGRKSLHICFERPAKDIFGKLYAAGGNGSEIKLVKKFVNSDGTKERLNLRKPNHKEVLYKMIEDGDYAYVIFDSVSAILTGNMNDREHVEDVFFDLLDRFEHKRTAFVCISHLKKDLRGLAAGGGMIGSVMQKNIAVSVCRLIKKIGEENKSILIKEKSNACKSKRGGLEIHIESKSIPQQYAIDGKLDVEKGTIEKLKYLDESPEMLRKQCVKDMVSEQKIPYFEMVREIIDLGKRKNNGRLPDTSYVENEIIAKGESPSKWKREQQSILNYLGYTTKSNRLRGKLHKYNIVEIEN